MAFTAITDVATRPDGAELWISWNTTAPAGTLFQVYLDRRLYWRGTDRSLVIPWPRQRVRIDVGSVGAGEGNVDYSGSLPSDPVPPDRVTLTWQGGDWQGPDLAGFGVYSSATPGGAVDYTRQIGFVPATVAGVDLGGYGFGGYGEGGYGQSAAAYSWTSDRLASGVWTFAVVPQDLAGNAQGSPNTVTATVVAPPAAPAPFADGSRLRYSYNPSTRVPTLTWNP